MLNVLEQHMRHGLDEHPRINTANDVTLRGRHGAAPAAEVVDKWAPSPSRRATEGTFVRASESTLSDRCARENDTTADSDLKIRSQETPDHIRPTQRANCANANTYTKQ